MKPSERINTDILPIIPNSPSLKFFFDKIIVILDEQDERIKKLEEQMDKIYIAYNSNLHPHTKSFLENNE